MKLWRTGLLISIVILLIIGIFPAPTHALAWYNASWNYRKSLLINHTDDGAQTNYQVKINVHYGAGIDDAANSIIHTPSASVGDFDDLFFTKDDGTTPLHYWIESYVAATSAVVWVEVDSIAVHPTNTTIYLYYGNAGAVAASSGTNTFQVFDDFSGGLGAWTTSGAAVSIVGGQLQIVGTAGTRQYAIQGNTYGDGIRVQSDCTIVGMGADFDLSSIGTYTDGNNYCLAQRQFSAAQKLIIEGKIAGVQLIQNIANIETTYKLRMLRDGDNAKAGLSTDGGTTWAETATIAHNLINQPVGSTTYDTVTGTFDNFFVANYTLNEPTWNSFGAEETYTAPPTLTTWFASGLGNTYAVINGEILSITTPILERWFEYGLTTALGSSSTPELGSFGTGPYSAYLSGLSKGTTYYFRAKVRDTTGIYSGLIKSFSTKGSPSNYEFNNTGGDGDSQWIFTNNVTAQTFYPNTSHSVTSIWLSLKRTGTDPGTIYVDLKSTSNCTTGFATCWCWATGEALATQEMESSLLSTSYQWWEFVFAEPICLSANTTYAIVVRAPFASTSAYIQWQWDSGGATGVDGNAIHSHDGQITWATDCPADYLYEVWGEPCLEVISAKVFKSYISDGDWLIVCHYKNFYPPYYDDAADVSELFLLQLVDGSTVLAQNPVAQWGYMPGCIYLSAVQVATLEWGHDYKVRIAGRFSPYPYGDYQLLATDWIGTDLVWLDRWCRGVAVLMEDFYSTTTTTVTLTESVSGKGLVLNEEGGVRFVTGIPALNDIRPDLFMIITKTMPYTQMDWTHSLQSDYVWQQRMGTELTTHATELGGVFMLSGAAVIGILIFLLFAVVVAFSFQAGHAIAAIALVFPLLLAAWWIGVWALVSLFVILSIIILFLTWQVIFKGG